MPDNTNKLPEPTSCPFCGSDWLDPVAVKPSGFVVNCHECGACGPISNEDDGGRDAIEQWNDRFGKLCPDCECDGSFGKPYPSNCPQNHLGKDMLMREKRRQARRARSKR